MDRNSERGNAIFMIFIAVALFGMLAYAFMHGSRGNISWITSEQAKTAAYSSQDCTNATNMAVKRLQTRGCDNMISYMADGSNIIPNAPTDGSCSVFHPNGGGAKPCNATALANDPCTTGPLGAVCMDFAIYIGTSSGNRIYAKNIDSSAGAAWSTPGFEDFAMSNTDGVANTDAMMARQLAGPNTYPAAAICRAHGTQWYLPSVSEALLLWTNNVALNLPSIGIDTAAFYWSSTGYTAGSANRAAHTRYLDGWQPAIWKTSSYKIRCVRR